MRAALVDIFGTESVSDDGADYAGDWTENAPAMPAFVVRVSREEQIPQLLALANERRIPITPRVAGTNSGGLAIPSEGGIVLELGALDSVAIDPVHMIAWIGPGVTWERLKAETAAHGLRLGYPLAPPDTSVLACALMDGLSTMSLSHGSLGDWVLGVEAYLADGTKVKTGSAAASGLPWPLSRGPLPDLTGLFVNWLGTTGITTRLALTLWPLRSHRRRDMIPCVRNEDAFELMRTGARTGLFDDIAGIGWPGAKWALGLDELGPRDPAEPSQYVIADYGADTEAEIELKHKRLVELAPVAPVPVADLVALAPELEPFSDLPTRLDFLLDHEGGGLTWVGTYGPLDKLEEGAALGEAILAEAGFPPLTVTRPMKGGHYAVLRMIERFDRRSEEETARVRKVNIKVGRALMELGYVPYKCPAVLYDELFARLDPGFLKLLNTVKRAVDPNNILSPARWRFDR